MIFFDLKKEIIRDEKLLLNYYYMHKNSNPEKADKALKILEKSKKIHANTYQELGNIFLNKGDQEKAKIYFKKASEIDNPNPNPDSKSNFNQYFANINIKNLIIKNINHAFNQADIYFKNKQMISPRLILSSEKKIEINEDNIYINVRLNKNTRENKKNNKNRLYSNIIANNLPTILKNLKN